MRRFKKYLSHCFLSACIMLPSLSEAAEIKTALACLKETPKKIETVVPKPKLPQKPFAAWLKDMRKEALQKSISQKVVNDALPLTLKPIDRVLVLDKTQPESKETFETYLTKRVPPRIPGGVEGMEIHKELLAKVSAAYGVEAEVIVALWGVETKYGQHTGSIEIVPALATLAHDGRRRDFFKGELLNALKILQQEYMPSSSLKGSWAGAFGQVQFMPSSYLKLAKDFDGDKKRDIWTNHADIFASAANYLAENGWKKGEPWGERIQLPADFDRCLLGMDQRHSLQFWRDKGVKLSLAGGAPKASVIQPDGPGTPAFAVYDNFRVILKWNRSNSFATSVGVLSDKLKRPSL